MKNSMQKATATGDGPRNRDGPVYIIDGVRTPFIKARGRPGPFTPVDLAVQCGRPLLLRLPCPPEAFDTVILGCVNVISDEMNPARIAALRLGMGDAMPAFTVQINCGSGMQSIQTANDSIRAGECDLVLAGGAEALSHAPLVFRRDGVEWFAALNRANSFRERLGTLAAFRPAFLKPVIGLERGLTDPIVDLNMGQTAEQLAYLFDISREESDQYAVSSHWRLSEAQNEGRLDHEIAPAIARDGAVYDHDDGVRPDTSEADLIKLAPAFERPYGQVTAGNSSQITDGASWVVVASERAVEQHGLTPKAVIVDTEWSALDPGVMGLGPVLSATPILTRQEAGLDDIDLWEINEAFAAQVLACLRAWADDDFCRDMLGLDASLGELDRKQLNVDGGAISLGHPVGTSGNRIVLHLVNALHASEGKRGIATECIGGGQGGAMLLEKV